jgi:hypothetical protein
MPPAHWFSTMLCFMAAMLLAGSASGQITTSGTTFAVTGVDVDVTAADAIKAREQGVREAQGKAVKLLIERMVAAEDRGKVPPLQPGQLEGMVRGVEFAQERSTSNHYAATLNVVFAAEPVKQWLASAGISLSETVARPALVVPLWKGKTGLEPLDDRNAWRDAWSKLDSAGSAVPVSVIRGDQLDEDALSVEQAYVGDVSALSRLNERYRAPSIVVATVEGDKSGGPLTVGGIRYDTQTGARSDLPKFTVPDPNQLGEAAKRLHAKLDEEWRGVAVVRRDSQDQLDVIVPIASLADWAKVRQRLGGVPAIKSMQVRALETDHADLHLEYFGTPQQLQQVLTQAGLTLEKNADRWLLQAR